MYALLKFKTNNRIPFSISTVGDDLLWIETLSPIDQESWICFNNDKRSSNSLMPTSDAASEETAAELQLELYGIFDAEIIPSLLIPCEYW